jgi:tetratricopeptide (TPR) repeat protein
MAVDPSAQQRLLKDAVGALKNGNRVRSRDLLLRVLEKDRDVEAAWWCLYQALDDTPGQTRALENVLRLNPQHAQAHQALLDVRQKRLAAATAAPAGPATFTFLPETGAEVDSDLDDQYQCPYCGHRTGIQDRRCPQCRGGLFVRVARTGGSAPLRLVVLLLGISLAAGVIEMVGPAIALGVSQGTADQASLQGLFAFPVTGLIFGDFLQLARPTAWLLLQIYVARAALLSLTLLSVRGRWRLGFYTGLICLVGDLLLSAYLLVNGDLGVIGAVFNGALALAGVTLLFGVSDDFALAPERLLVKPATTARSALDFYKLGHLYRQRGMWAMAVAQWRRAVGLAPQTPQFYKHLGIGYAQLKRYDRSLRTLEEGRRQAPDDRDIAEVIALVKSQADMHALLKK